MFPSKIFLGALNRVYKQTWGGSTQDKGDRERPLCGPDHETQEYYSGPPEALMHSAPPGESEGSILRVHLRPQRRKPLN